MTNIHNFSDQLSLFDSELNTNSYFTHIFSANNICTATQRLELEAKYASITEVSNKFDRKAVSFQLSKNDPVHRWLKYKEGFSSELVSILLQEMDLDEEAKILDPFAGSGTTQLVAQLQGLSSIGFDILPTSSLVAKVKTNITEYSISELTAFQNYIKSIDRPPNYCNKINFVKITEDAYPNETDFDLAYFTTKIKESPYSDGVKDIGILSILNSLERLSYTCKDGQYLRWDERSYKVITANKNRINQGKPTFKTVLNKGILPTVTDVLSTELEIIINDIKSLGTAYRVPTCDTIYYEESSLYGLPKISDKSINAVITSPPYCNRYDYTRTYALELAYLGLNEAEFKNLRQELLTCTVENKPKLEKLKTFYLSLGKIADYKNILHLVSENKVLQEIIQALEFRLYNGEINNKGIISMVKGYFTEMTFIIYELYRICANKASIAIVNDNVRYAGEVIPVDYLSTYIAEMVGFYPKKIYTLSQKKGNSSQQMKKYGRQPLRKSITIWCK